MLRLDFGSGDYEQPNWLTEDAAAQLEPIEKRASIAGDGSAPARLRRLLGGGACLQRLFFYLLVNIDIN